MTDHEFFHSARWMKLRESVLRRDGYECQVAKRYGRHVPATIVHHIFPRSSYPEYAFCAWNLISVSKRGHSILESDDGLTAEGRALMMRTARARGIELSPRH